MSHEKSLKIMLDKLEHSQLNNKLGKQNGLLTMQLPPKKMPKKLRLKKLRTLKQDTMDLKHILTKLKLKAVQTALIVIVTMRTFRLVKTYSMNFILEISVVLPKHGQEEQPIWLMMMVKFLKSIER